jgi:hypothetical protein
LDDLLQPDFEAISREFALEGTFLRADLLRSGHIHDTYAVRLQGAAGPRRYVIQRINTEIFRDLECLTSNVVRVTEHLNRKLAAATDSEGRQEALNVIPTHAGEPLFRDTDGGVWRAYDFIEHTRTVDIVEHPDQAREGAYAFGTFLEALADLPLPRLHETLPCFHDTPRRFAAFKEAVDAVPQDRASEAKDEVAFALARAPLTELLSTALARGDLPERVTHNDTKINNVLFDVDTGEGVCVIDLDTVMPGAAAYDFGDLVRTTTATAAEDEPDLRKVRLRLDLFEAVVHGFLDAASELLTPAEVESLVVAGKVITFETGLRFLADFLQGDIYFKTARPAHNLDRARTQFELVRQLEEQEPQLQTIVERYA